MCSYGWRRQIPALVDAGFHVIVPDWRVYNLSSVLKGVKAYILPQLGADIIGLLDHFGICGFSTSPPGGIHAFSDEEIIHDKEAWSNAGGLTGAINWYRALVRYRSSTPADIRLRMPVLIQWGKRDTFLMHQMAEASLKLCDNGKLIFYEDATHWVQHKAADVVNQALIGYFD